MEEIETKKPEKKEAPKKSIKSFEYDLFSQFVTNDEKHVSNTVEIWECIPKYFLTPKKCEELRTPTGHADPYRWDYYYRDTEFSVKIQPALVEEEDRTYKAYFPGPTEELVEEVLKKILSDQNFGIHDPEKKETWVKFSLSMIHKELKLMGRERNRNQIKHAIEVMSSSVLTLYKGKKEIWRGSIIQDLVTVGREEYLSDTDSLHVARLPLFISQSIDQLDYRQFNYGRLMDCNEQLTRWLYKQLINRYKQANTMNSYHFTYSNVVRDSGLLQRSTERKNRQKLISALEELKTTGAIISYEEEVRKEGLRIIDAIYNVTPSLAFISEQKAANKRSKDAIDALVIKNIASENQ